MRLTTADLVVLSVLSYEGPMHGYELVKLLEERDFEDWSPISRPQVYYSMRKLADAGYLIAAKDNAPALGPDRIVYKPAQKARRAMQTALGDAKWINQRPPSPFITWTSLALLANKPTVEKQIALRAAFLKKEIAREEETLVSFKGGKRRDIALARALVSLTIRQFQAELDALDEIRAVLVKGS